jgi:hypothetical protein
MTDASISAAVRVVRRLDFITLSLQHFGFVYRIGPSEDADHPVFMYVSRTGLGPIERKFTDL